MSLSSEREVEEVCVSRFASSSDRRIRFSLSV
jgi:hypothetical protein